MQVPGMTVMMSPVTTNVTGTYGSGYMVYILQVCCRSWTQGMTMTMQPKLHCTAREEVKIGHAMEDVSQREEGYEKIKLSLSLPL